MNRPIPPSGNPPALPERDDYSEREPELRERTVDEPAGETPRVPLQMWRLVEPPAPKRPPTRH